MQEGTAANVGAELLLFSAQGNFIRKQQIVANKNLVNVQLISR